MRFSSLVRQAQSVKYINSIFFINLFIILLTFIAFLPLFIGPVGLSIDLPKVVASESISDRILQVTISKDNSIFLGDKKVSLDGLRTMLSKKDHDYQIYIMCDVSAKVGTLAMVWGIIRDMGFRKVNIATND